MDCFLCATSWRVSERIWDNNAIILLAGLLIGRAAAPLVLRRVSEAALVLISLFVAGAGLVVILAGSSLMTVSSGAGLTGLGLAAVFPTTFGDLHPAFRKTGVATDWILLCAGRPGRSAYSLAGGFHFSLSLGTYASDFSFHRLA